MADSLGVGGEFPLGGGALILCDAVVVESDVVGPIT